MLINSQVTAPGFIGLSTDPTNYFVENTQALPSQLFRRLQYEKVNPLLLFRTASDRKLGREPGNKAKKKHSL